jgi:hypothetical protein
MAVVVHIVEYSNRDTVSLLKCLLDDALRGEIAGLALCFKDRDGQERAAFSGTYRGRPSEAASAAMRLSWRLTQLSDPTWPPAI